MKRIALFLTFFATVLFSLPVNASSNGSTDNKLSVEASTTNSTENSSAEPNIQRERRQPRVTAKKK